MKGEDMGRLIDADALIAYMEEKADETKQLDNIIVAVVCSAVSEQPTAYDVEKVVAELEKESKTMLPVIPTSKAIDIVKRGGVE